MVMTSAPILAQPALAEPNLALLSAREGMGVWAIPAVPSAREGMGVLATEAGTCVLVAGREDTAPVKQIGVAFV
jgi:hypothetical protein